VSSVVMLCLVEKSLNSWLSERPGASVERLFLGPDDCLRIWIAVKILLELLPWEWVQLLNTSNGGVLDVVVGAVLVEGSIDLSRAQDDTFDVFGFVDCVTVLNVLDNPLELRVTSEVLNGRTRKRMTKEGLGEEDDKCCKYLARVHYEI